MNLKERIGNTTERRNKMESVREIIGQAIGEASMCWSETPKGTFDSEKAAKIVERLANKLSLKNIIKGGCDVWGNEVESDIEL